MQALGKQPDRALVEAAALLAEIAPEIPGATERQVLWLRGFARWVASPERIDPILADRQRVRDRLLDELMRLHPELAARARAACALGENLREENQ